MCLRQDCLQKGISFQPTLHMRQDLLCEKSRKTNSARGKTINGRMIFDKRTIAFRQTLDWASTNARLGLDKRSFVPRLPIVCEPSNARLVFSLRSRGISVPIEGIPRCFLGGLPMLSRESADALDGIPSMVIRDPFDGNTGLLRWEYDTPLMDIQTSLIGNRGCSRQILRSLRIKHKTTTLQKFQVDAFYRTNFILYFCG